MPDVLPTAQVPRRRGVRLPGDPGAGEALGALADGAERLAAKLQKQQDDGDRLALIGAETQLRADETQRLVSEGDGLADTALDGFGARFAAGFDERAAVARAVLPERLQPQFDAVAGAARADFALKAGEIEHARRTSRNTRALDDQLDAAGRTVAADPTAFMQGLADARAAVAAADVPEEAKAARLARLPNQLARERFVGLAQSDPDAVARDLDTPQWAALFTPEQALALKSDARSLRRQLEADAVDAIEPRANEAVNRIIGAPARFTSEIAALREDPALAHAPAAVREDVLRRVAGRGAEARLTSIGEDNPWAAKQELLSGQHDAWLPAGDKQRLLGAFDRDIERRAAAAAAEAHAARAERAAAEGDALKATMESALLSAQTTGRAAPVDRGRLVAAFGEERAQAFDDAVQEAKGLYVQGRILTRLPAGEIDAFVSRFAPQAGSPTFAHDARYYAAVSALADAERKARRDDPAGAALRRPEVQQALNIHAAMSERGGDASDARRRYVEASRAAQTAMGVPESAQRVVPQSAVAAAVARLRAAGPDTRAKEAAAIVADMQQTWGPSASEALARIAAPPGPHGDGGAGMPQLEAIVPIAGRPDAQRVAAALTAPNPPREALPGNARSRIAQGVVAELAPLTQSLSALPGGDRRAATVRAAAEKLALLDAAAGADPAAAARAAAAIYTADYGFADGVRLPKRWRGAPLEPSVGLFTHQ